MYTLMCRVRDSFVCVPCICGASRVRDLYICRVFGSLICACEYVECVKLSFVCVPCICGASRVRDLFVCVPCICGASRVRDLYIRRVFGSLICACEYVEGVKLHTNESRTLHTNESRTRQWGVHINTLSVKLSLICVTDLCV